MNELYENSNLNNDNIQEIAILNGVRTSSTKISTTPTRSTNMSTTSTGTMKTPSRKKIYLCELDPTELKIFN